MINVVSYGGGVQSTAIVLMAIDGLIPKPDYVIFADTGSEMESTYKTVKEIKKLCKKSEINFKTVYSNFGKGKEYVKTRLHKIY